MDVNKILEDAKVFLESAIGSAPIIALVVEFLLRTIKSEKPMSLIYGFVKIVRMLGVAANKFSDLCEKIGELADKVFGQRLKDEEAKEQEPKPAEGGSEPPKEV